MPRIRAIIFDLDDTLLRDDLSISDYTVGVLRRCRQEGIHIIPASGRTRESMLPFVRRIGCASLYAAANGAEIYAPEKRLLRSVSFPRETAEAIARFGEARDCYAQTYDDAHFYFTRDNDWAVQYARASVLTGIYQPDLISFLQTHVTAKILMMNEPPVIARMLMEARKQFAGQASVTCSKPYFLEFNPPEATKGAALRWCAGYLGFPLSAAAAFGDSLNDLSMLEAAGTGVCVANAQPDVRALISRTCGANSEDGVARYIESELLNEPISAGGAHD